MRWKRLLVLSILGLAYIQNLLHHWHEWGDPIIDCGRELDVPRQLLAGATLYRDIRYWYGPLAPYANTLLYRVFGVHADVLSCAGWISVILAAWIGYRTIRLLADRVTAGIGVLAFFYMNAFAFYYTANIFNFVLPYSYPATYGTVLGLASVYCLMRFVRKQRWGDLVMAGGLLSLTALCKVEVLFATALAHAVFAAGALRSKHLHRIRLLAFYAGVAAVPAAIYMYFYGQIGSALWSDNLLVSTNLAANGLTLSREGFARMGEFTAGFLRSTHGMAGCLAVLWVLARTEKWICGEGEASSPRGRAFLAGVAIAGSAMCASVYLVLGPFLALRTLPALLLVAIALDAQAIVRNPGGAGARRRQSALLLEVFALALLARILLRCGADYYGFYMAVPGVLVLAIFWCHTAPRVMTRRGALPARAARLCGCVIMASIVWTHVARTEETFRTTYHDIDRQVIRTARGAIPCPDVSAEVVARTVAHLGALPPETSVVVLPEGAAMTFLAGCTNPLGLHTFLPLDFSGSYSDAAFIARLERAAPDVIVRTSRNLGEYGRAGLGIDYGVQLSAWVDANYREVHAFTGESAYRITILERSR